MTTRPRPWHGRSPCATRSYVPRSERFRRRRSAPSTTVVRCPVLCFRLSPLTASHPQDGAGNAFAASAAPVWLNSPPTPTPALGTLCPPVGRFAPSACGASGFAAIVSNPISCPCRVRIPLSKPPILLTCDQRVACCRRVAEAGDTGRRPASSHFTDYGSVAVKVVLVDANAKLLPRSSAHPLQMPAIARESNSGPG